VSENVRIVTTKRKSQNQKNEKEKLEMKEHLECIAADLFAENVCMIDEKDLHSSPDNFFEIGRIEELAEIIYE
jgi:hypothetical protein